MADPTFAQLVSLACHDLRTPLATASGFAYTLRRLGLEAPADRYIEMIEAASGQIGDLVDLLSAAARIEAGRFEPHALEIDSREVVDAAASRLGENAATVDGPGGPVRADRAWAETALAALGECIRRHGALERVDYAVDGAAVTIGPVREGVGPLVVGAELKDFAAAVGSRVLSAMGASLELDGERLSVRLPAA